LIGAILNFGQSFWFSEAPIIQAPLSWRLAHHGREAGPISHWFEEDCDGYKVAPTFKDAFTPMIVIPAQEMFDKYLAKKLRDVGADYAGYVGSGLELWS
jgi:hypothetical protein